jgi:hypothetical protein
MMANEIGRARNVHGEVNNVCRYLNGRHPRHILKNNNRIVLREEDIEI